MTLFKIIIIALTAIIAIGGFYLSKPNRPKLASFLSFLIIISAISGIVLEVKDAKSKKQKQDKVVAQNTELLGEIENLNDQNKELITGNAKVVAQNTTLSGEIKKLDGQNKELIAGKDKLLAQNTTLIGLNTKLSEKIELYQKDLQEKEKKIEELDKKAKMSARNVTSTYDFNGAKRQTSAGRISVNVGEEAGIYMQIRAYANAGDFPNLIKLCEEQIEKTPEWYTPFYYLAMAQADTGLKDEAIKNMQYVVDNTPGDPDYAKAPEILKMLKQQP